VIWESRAREKSAKVALGRILKTNTVSVRALQNVIFEVGWFSAKFGGENAFFSSGVM
jgi:hypothetical protein